MCETREFIMGYAILATMVHLSGMAFIGLNYAIFSESDKNTPMFVFYETERTIEMAMSVYLFLSMLNFSKTMLRHFLLYLRCWVGASIVYVILYMTLLLGAGYDIVFFRSVKVVGETHEQQAQHVHRATGSLQVIVISAILGVEAHHEETMHTISRPTAAARIMVVIFVICLLVAYSMFLYWRLNRFYKSMLDEGAVKMLPPQFVVSPYEPQFAMLPPQYAMPPPQFAVLQPQLAVQPGELAMRPSQLAMRPSQLAMQQAQYAMPPPEYGMPPIYEPPPRPGTPPLYGVPTREQLQPYYAPFPQSGMPPRVM